VDDPGLDQHGVGVVSDVTRAHDNRRHDDPHGDTSPEAADHLFGSIPDVLRKLRETEANQNSVLAALEQGRQDNRRIASQGRAIAVFVGAAMLLGGWVLQYQHDQAEARARDVCTDINQNASAINAFVDALIASTTTNKQYTQEEKQVRIERYRDLYQQVPRCIPGEEIP
jgi:hypothetical protein